MTKTADRLPALVTQISSVVTPIGDDGTYTHVCTVLLEDGSVWRQWGKGWMCLVPKRSTAEAFVAYLNEQE